jgi:hypothetical protein
MAVRHHLTILWKGEEQMTDPVSVFWVIVGILVWPELTLCVILWKLDHPYLGVFALIFASTTSVKTVVKERILYRDRR